MKKYKQQVKDGKENSGFISHIVDEKPIFIHYSFTQYFAALFYFNNVKREKVRKFFFDQIYGKKQYLTSIFFDYMVTDGETNCEVHIAVLNSDEKEVRKLLTNADKVKDFINARDRIGRTALHVAAAYGYYDVTMTLLEHRYSVAAEDLFGWKPIRYADKNGHWDIADLLLKNGANIDDMCETMNQLLLASVAKLPVKTLLHKAAEKGLLTLLNALLKSKSKLINKSDIRGQKPLHYAANKDIAEILITNGADIEAKNYRGETPIFLANSEEVVKFLIKQGADLEARNRSGDIFLHKTVKESRQEMVELIISHGANIEVKNKDNRTPLFFANNREVVDLLISNGVDVKAESSNGETPLHVAVAKTKEMVELLISHGADIEAKNIRGETPLFFADSEDVVEFLIEKGADINVQSSHGDTPLHEAVRRSKGIVKLLLSHGADIEAKNSFEATPLFYAYRKEIVEILISQGANVNARHRLGNTPLHECLRGSKEIVEVLLSHGADIEAKGFDDKTPLFYAERNEIIEYLISQGADINAKDRYGHTALQYALRWGREKMAELGLTPLEFFNTLLVPNAY
ncbi:putative ankyrin repeat protein RF_0381 [Parasteatoda tepidariorum]|uniref:putative ankyrin repeat protein RF_0381 n=1 Tax=Parasteatoda tepidariorum TaxID=114398 RepID=UPI001C726A01|nr:putative ankyrin repeat protein RF_0381 [Parasteatoda tepidariorum]